MVSTYNIYMCRAI